MADIRDSSKDFPTGIQQQNLESKLKEITDKSNLKGLKHIKTQRFWTFGYYDHSDAMALGSELNAEFYYRNINLIWSTYKFYIIKN